MGRKRISLNKGWPNEPVRHSCSAYGIKTSTKSREIDIPSDIPKSEWPAIGVVTFDGEIVSYPKSRVDEYQHHSFILNKEEMDLWKNYGENMRFVLYGNDTVGLKGKPSLQPFQRGNYQIIKDLSEYLIENGLPPNTTLRVDKQKMGTEFEGKEIGKLKEFASGEFDEFV